MNLLAVDAGTSAVKAAIVDDEGVIVAVERAAIVRNHQVGINPVDYWAAVAAAIRQVVGSGHGVDAIAVTGQGDGLWALDNTNAPVALVHEWNSTVAGEVVARWEADGVVEDHFRDSGTVLWSGTSAAIWTWLSGTQRATATSISSVFCAKDWINFQLTGAIATDVTDASIPFLDMETGAYDARAFDRLGCTPLLDIVAPIVASGTEIGTVTKAGAEATGLSEGIPVLMGCIDGVALMYGAGLQEPGDALAVLGTTAAGLVITDELDTTGEAVGATLRMPFGNRFVRVMGANSGTSTLDWYLDTIAASSPDPLTQFWQQVSTAKPGVVMLPYLAGERVPFLAPEATGNFLGLTSTTRPEDIARSVAMGITFSLRHCIDSTAATNVDSIVLTGGGAASPTWCQLVADITGSEVNVDDRPHVACDGVAALVMGRTVSDVPFTSYQPSADYEDEYHEFVSIGQRMRSLWSDMKRQSPEDR